VLFHHRDEILEARIAVVRPRARLRVVLDGHGHLFLVHHPGAGSVVEVDVRHFHFFGKRRGVHGEVVVLRADLDAACDCKRKVSVLYGQTVSGFGKGPTRTRGAANRVVPAVVPELHLERLASERLPEHLVAHADAEHGNLAQNRLGVLHRVRHRGRVTRAV
jgi:hypothetical protein